MLSYSRVGRPIVIMDIDSVLSLSLISSIMLAGVVLDHVWNWTEVILVFLCLGFLNGLYSRYWHPLAKYPGPFWASVTNLWRFITFYQGEHHLIDQKLHEQYGPIVRTGPNSLSFSTLTAYDSIYGFHSTMEKGDWYQPTRDTATKHAPLFGIRTNEEQRAQRKKVLVAAFASSKVATYRPVMEEHVRQLLEEIEEMRAISKDSAIDVVDLFHHYTFDSYYEVVFGELPAYNTPEDRMKTSKTIQMANKGLGAGYLPWLGKLLSSKPIAAFIRRPKYSKTGELIGFSAIARRSFTRILGGQVEIIKSSQPSVLQNFLLVPESEERRLSPRVIALESFNSLFAGPGTSAAALTSIVWYLAQPEGQVWQDRIWEECAQKGIQASTALNAVIKETLRLNPPFPSGMPRTTTKRTKIAVDDTSMVDLPKNTMVSCNLYVLSRSKEIWGADAEDWKPERWLERTDSPTSDSPQTSQPFLSLEERFLVFGKGPRSCIGREIALILLGETIAKILERYRIKTGLSLKGANFFEMQYSECLVELIKR